MAALSVTAAQVKKGSTGKVLTKVCGATIDAGQAVADVAGTIFLFEADHTTTTKAVFAGVAVNKTQLIGQEVSYVYDGPIILGTTCAMTLGKVYLGGLTAGAITPAGDTTNTGRVNIIGVCTETTSGTLTINKFDSAVNGAI